MPVYQHEAIIPKLWGYEKVIVNENNYCGKILTLLPNKNASSIHFHKKKIETFHVINGYVQYEIWKCHNKYYNLDIKDYDLVERATMVPGMSLTIQPLQPHRFWATDEITQFIEFSTPDDPNDSYRIVPAGIAPS